GGTIFLAMFFFSSRRRHTRFSRDWSSDVCSSDLPTAVVGPGEAIRLPNLEDRIDHEAELAVVIGKRGKNIPRERAEEYIFGYTCANDVSNRVLQARDGQNTRAKSFDTFKPLGPAIETEL